MRLYILARLHGRETRGVMRMDRRWREDQGKSKGKSEGGIHDAQCTLLPQEKGQGKRRKQPPVRECGMEIEGRVSHRRDIPPSSRLCSSYAYAKVQEKVKRRCH